MNCQQTAIVFKALLQGPVSRIDLADRADVMPKTVGKLLSELKRQKLIYVIGYVNDTDGRNRVKIYTLGDGEDVSPRNAKPQQERNRKSYLRKVAANNETMPVTTFVGGRSLWQ